jgi:tRNA uracil 4-sulfurtransferase
VNKPVIVVHYHELWLKGRNRNFFLAKLSLALRRALDGLSVTRIGRPGDRLLIELDDAAHLPEAIERLKRVSGISSFAVAQPVERDLDAMCRAAWQEVAPEKFSSFAVRAKRSDKSFPHNVVTIERNVGGYLHDQLLAAGREARVDLNHPELTCRIEIPPGPAALVYARRIAGTGGLPPNTGGRMLCLLSGGFDSAVAAWKMMKRGAHVTFAHFYGGGARPGESSVHVARELVRTLTPWQFTAKLFLVPFEEIQREIVHAAPETFRLLLYRRLMLRIAEQLARRDHALAIVTGDSLGQVASQTLKNMVAVSDCARLPVFRPLAGDDKIEIIDIAKRIGTHDISAEPFHDCCPVFLPKVPALHATIADLDAAEATLDLRALVRRGVESAQTERFRFAAGRVESVVGALEGSEVGKLQG